MSNVRTLSDMNRPAPQATQGRTLGGSVANGPQTNTTAGLHVVQEGSTHTGNIKIASKASANQGNSAKNVSKGSLEQKGHRVDGDIELDEEGNWNQGNAFDGGGKAE